MDNTQLANETIRSIRDFMSAFSEQMQRIGATTHDQTVASDRIAQTMDAISRTSQTNQANAECMAAVDELVTITLQTVASFKLD